MRTTVTLDPDVVEQLRGLARRRSLSFKAALNNAVRAGLAAERSAGRVYTAPARPMRMRPGIDLTQALRMADSLEDEEIARKLEQRKLSNVASMKLPDANLLLYALDEASPHHAPARSWLEQTLSGIEPVGFAWAVLLAFLRLSTRAQLFASPLEPVEAFDVVDGWLAQPCALVLHPTERHLAILRGLVEPLRTSGNITGDAHLAALAIEYGGEVCSADTDFARFQGLRWKNPLE